MQFSGQVSRKTTAKLIMGFDAAKDRLNDYSFAIRRTLDHTVHRTGAGIAHGD